MEDGELYATAFDEDDNELNFRLYPTGDGEFGRKGGMLKLKLDDGCLTIGETTCKKLK